MKKCPECGNPSYDGAPVCGNCGFKFPKPKVKAPIKEDIFENKPKLNISSNEQSTIEIIKENKIVIGAILLITLLVIGIIVVTGPNNQSSININGTNTFSSAGLTFDYPSTWNDANGTDELHENAVYYEDTNGTLIEYYNVTSEFSSINQLNTERVSSALQNGAYINTVQVMQIGGNDSSNVILENADGTYTRYVSLMGNGMLYVFKITGSSIDAVRTNEIESVLNSVKY